MSAPTTYSEVKTTWSTQVSTALYESSALSGWASITLPVDGVECNTNFFKADIFPVDVNALVTLCATVADCDFVSTDYASYAFGFALNRGPDPNNGQYGGPCEDWAHPFLFTKDDSVLPFDSIFWGSG